MTLHKNVASPVGYPPPTDGLEQRAPAPDMIDIGGRRLALTRVGRGGPTVILEAGLGAESREWAPIQRALADRATVCFYDRANRGVSDPAPGPRSARAMVDDLAKLVRAAALPAPYLIVGHSFGGLIARLFASDRPQRSVWGRPRRFLP